MLKEIHEQPEALRATVNPRVQDGLPALGVPGLTDEYLAGVENIHIVACGTAMHAGMVGKTAIERIARVPVYVDIASEFRYRDPILGKNDLVVIISQSGETLDTLAACFFAASSERRITPRPARQSSKETGERSRRRAGMLHPPFARTAALPPAVREAGADTGSRHSLQTVYRKTVQRCYTLVVGKYLQTDRPAGRSARARAEGEPFMELRSNIKMLNYARKYLLNDTDNILPFLSLIHI